MKPFFESVGSEFMSAPMATDIQTTTSPQAGAQARIAIYDSPLAAPRVVPVESADPTMFIESVSTETYSLARDMGGGIPYTAIREVVENLIHADFKEPVVSIMDNGGTIRFADQGPGIPDKRKACLPGFTTATQRMKNHIRGVGSGLPIVSEYLSHSGGDLCIEDNLGIGTVVTLSCSHPNPIDPSSSTGEALYRDDPALLSTRQKKVLSLVMEAGEAGPTLVAHELAVGLSTAHRDLASLEEGGFILSDSSGKRILTQKGHRYLDELFRG